MVAVTMEQENIKIECLENCGNSPKKTLLKDLGIAFVTNKIDHCLEWLTEDITIEMVGNKQIDGIDNVKKWWENYWNYQANHLRIINIITHGNTASINGTLHFNDHHDIAFCHVLQFRGFGKNAKIKKITAYIIPSSN